MGLFGFGEKPSINDSVKLCKETPSAVLLDVRDADEFATGHIPGAVNLPLSRICEAEDRFPDADTPLFVYCLSGAQQPRRSGLGGDGLHQCQEHRRHSKL